jgi:putative transposase
MSSKTYPSDLTDIEWEVIEPLVPAAHDCGRPPEYHKRDIVDAIFYIVRSGCSWRMLPSEMPPWATCYHYFSAWKKDGLWLRIHDTLRDRTRLDCGKKKPRPLRSSTLKALRLLATREFADMMQEKELREESGIYSWTRLDSCSSRWFTKRTSKTGTELDFY